MKKLRLFENLKKKINEDVMNLHMPQLIDILKGCNPGEFSDIQSLINSSNLTTDERQALVVILDRLDRQFYKEYSNMSGGDLYNKLDVKFGNNWSKILNWLEQEVQRYQSVVYESLQDKSAKELLEIIRNGGFPNATQEESDAFDELESRLSKVFGNEYKEKYGTTELDNIFAKMDGGRYTWEDFVEWLSKEVDRYQSAVNESKKAVNESRNPRKGDVIIIDGDVEVKVVHSFTSAKSAASYERKVNIAKDDGYSVSERIESGIIDPNESGVYVYALYGDKIRLFDFTDGDVDWEIKGNKE